MFIIASEQTRELDRLQKYLDKLSQPYRVFVTNLETDLAQQTESLATFFTQKDPASKIGKPLFLMVRNVVPTWFCERISCLEQLTEWNRLVREKRSYPLMSTTAMAGEANRVSLRNLANHI